MSDAVSTTSRKPRRIGLLPGDGIGPEVVAEAVRVLKVVVRCTGHEFEFREGLIGGSAIDATGHPLPQETLDLCQWSEAVLHGAVGGPRWDHLPWERNPGPGGLLRLRREFDLFANLRPVRAYLPDQVQVRQAQIDMLMVREATGGLYFAPGRGREEVNGRVAAFDVMRYEDWQVERVVRVACRLARQRRGRLCSVDKANVLESSKLWREVTQRVTAEYPDIQVEHLYVDNFAMQLILRPHTFDVIVTENMFGDILSDEGAGLVGSLGLLPSASLREDAWGLYEPVHGSAPDIAGTGKANPTAAILSAAMLLRYSLGLAAEADAVEAAVEDVLAAGIVTPDLANAGQGVSTQDFGAAVAERVAQRLSAAAGS